MFIPRRHENGGICCSDPKTHCDKCKAHHRAASANPYLAPDSYAQGLKSLQAASHSTFEDDWKAQRFAALAKEHAQIDAHSETPRSRLTTAERNEYPAPDPYKAGLQALQKKENR